MAADGDGREKHVPRIFDRKYFEIINVESNDKVLAKCKHCANKNIAGGLVYTSNFKVHMKV